MPSTRKAKKSPVSKKPASSPSKVPVLQENIRLVANEVRGLIRTKPSSAVAPKTHSPKKQVSFQELPSSSAVVTAPESNPYAREIFLAKTNVREIAREEVAKMQYEDPAKREYVGKRFRDKLYRLYVNEPKFRIRDPLDRLRFESPYYEYRMHLAMAKGMCSEEEYQDYKEQVTAAGMSECWVDMRADNLLLEHEDKIVEQVKRKVVNWSWKLEKLLQYVMERQRIHERRQEQASNASNSSATDEHPEEQIDELLDAVLHRSNAKEELSTEQIKSFYRSGLLLAPECRFFKWLQFEDDALNRRFQKGQYAVIPGPDTEDDEDSTEAMVGVIPLEKSVAESEHSNGSEIDQMQAEMAMTQPVEVVPPNGGNAFYQNTEEMICALEPTQNLPDPIATNVSEEQQPEDAPMPEQSKSAEPSEEFSLLTPGQQEVIVITDSPGASPCHTVVSDFKEELLWVDLETVRKFTNIDQWIIDNIRASYPDKAACDKKLSRLDKFVAKFYQEHLEEFKANKLPNGLYKLSRRARRDREASLAEVSPQQRTPAPAASVAPSLPRHRDTPMIQPVTQHARRINYEDSPDTAAAAAADETMPDSENFQPPDCSTQVQQFGGPMLSSVAPGTPRPSPQKQPAAPAIRHSVDSVASRPSTPFASESFNETIRTNDKRPSPRRVKIERNTSGYAGEVEEVPIDNAPIAVDDSINHSQLDVNALIERHQNTDGCHAMPADLQTRADNLFQRHASACDVTVSQSSSNSSGSGGQSMGFRSKRSD